MKQRRRELSPAWRNCVLAQVVLLVTAAGAAQDRRHVAEPRIPKACSVLKAKLAPEAGKLAEADEEKLDTSRLQGALDGCKAGQAVELAADGERTAFLSGPLALPVGVTLLVDRDVTLFGSRDPLLYAKAPGSCGLVNNEHEQGCKPLISATRAPHAAVMGDGTINGRGYAKLLHGDVTWWQLAEQARKGGRQQVPRLIIADGSDDFTLYRITLKNSANFHVVFSNAKGLTVWGLKIDTPQKARNTDGVDPGSASDITITHSFISTGDDHVAIKGSGTGVQHMSVLDNHFYYGHGMSIGSETFAGVSDLLVRDLTIDGADNGLRIKSNVHRGGLVQHVLYDDVCIRGTKVPITIDTRYDNPGPDSNRIPDFRDVHFHNVAVSGGGKIVVDGQDAQHVSQVQFDGVHLDDPAAYTFFAKDADVTYGPGAVNFRLQGENVHAREVPDGSAASGASASTCSGRFVPFPR